MAVTETAKTGSAPARSGADEDRISELELQVQELSATVELLTKAHLSAIGIDPAAAARRALGRTVVQFSQNYNRLPQASTVKDAPNVVEGYAVGAFEVVRLRNDEVARIQGDFPGIIEADQSKFVPFPKRIPFMGKDANGRPRWETKIEPIAVKTLVEQAPNVA